MPRVGAGTGLASWPAVTDYRLPRLRLVAAALVSVSFSLTAACGEDNDAGDSTGTSTDTGADTDTDADTSSSGGEPSPLEIGACAVTPDCPALCIHLNWGDCSDEPALAHSCGAKLLLSGEAGVLEAIEAIGPETSQVQELIVLGGDGTALTQRRTRASSEAPWSDPEPVKRCDVVAPDVADACAKDEPGCIWDPSAALAKCQDVALSTCAEVEPGA